ncbi:MAG: porin [Rhodospirillales bacterium]|nr:porin [Alphaproteobacteria bacterium]USO04104.1 MAG: porin [Rhodospirillales bacterium]
MKKLLLCSAAVVGMTMASAPAMAQVDLTVGGHTKNYVGWLDQDTSSAANTDERNFDILRESELHINAEATADNGLTYGFHLELEVDGGDAANIPEESYLYLASDLGRVNIGSEDGAAYLLQVAAPSADSNIDGIRQYIQPVNYAIASTVAAVNTYLGTTVNTPDGFDYDNDLTGQAGGADEKLTYLSPIWNGFQFGVSYTPDAGDAASASGREGFNRDDVNNAYGEAYEGAVRYEGQFNNVGFAVGGGYTHVELENEVAGGALDDMKEWNVGLDLDIGAFGVGAVYTENNNGTDVGDEDDTIVVGVDYTTGPFKLGASYYNKDDENGLAAGQYDTKRYTGGVIYTAAPGLSFRGSISFIDHDVPAAIGSDVEATSVLGGIQFNF